jgi:hypothetical protein
MIDERSASIEAILLTSPDCLLCHEAEAMLNELAIEYPLIVTVVVAASPQGAALAERHALPFTPSLVLAGDPFGYGHLSRRAIRREIETRLSTATRAATPAPTGRRDTSGGLKQTLRRRLFWGI